MLALFGSIINGYILTRNNEPQLTLSLYATQTADVSRNIALLQTETVKAIHLSETDSPPLTGTPSPALALIDVETNATLRRDVNQALSLYTDNATITDVRSSKQWSGIEQIRSRYQDIFAQAPLIEDIHEILDVKIEQDKVTVKVRQHGKLFDLKTNTVIDIPLNQEVWYFANLDGKWKIVEFVYGLPN